MPTFAEQNELSAPQQILQQPVFGKETRLIFNRKNTVAVYMEIKVTATPGDDFIFCFLSEKINQQSEKDHWSTDPPHHLFICLCIRYLLVLLGRKANSCPCSTPESHRRHVHFVAERAKKGPTLSMPICFQKTPVLWETNLSRSISPRYRLSWQKSSAQTMEVLRQLF